MKRIREIIISRADQTIARGPRYCLVPPPEGEEPTVRETKNELGVVGRLVEKLRLNVPELFHEFSIHWVKTIGRHGSVSWEIGRVSISPRLLWIYKTGRLIADASTFLPKTDGFATRSVRSTAP
jgi:hypothetical protein